jgi:pimeloyl-ACP methyl ester carboxylesterase
MLQNFLYNLTTTPGNTVSQITLIGHSMGGLVSRAYLESIALSSSTKSAQDATILGMIDQLITLGTPHLGAPMALGPISRTLELVSGMDDVFLAFLSVIWPSLSPAGIKNLTDIIDNVVNSNPWGVSTYELLPNYAFIDAGGNLPIYPYNNLPPDLIDLLNKAGLVQANLNTAIAFFNALSYGTNPNPKILYQCIYGVVDLLHRSPELKLALLDKTTTGYTFTAPSTLTAVRTVGGGDLVVPATSAMFTGNKSVPAAQQHKVLGADHLTMPSNPNIWSVVNGLLFPKS